MVIAYCRFDDELPAEREFQAIFSRQRVHPRREFFEATIKEARGALLRLTGAKVGETESTAERANSPE
jgi:hypothetical protein